MANRWLGPVLNTDSLQRGLYQAGQFSQTTVSFAAYVQQAIEKVFQVHP